MALQAGARLGPYEILAPIGAGGMGEVYRARDPRLGREVAIKVLPHDRVADESRRQRFIQEAQAASALNHPHIVTIHEIESADGIDFLVMEYVRGKSLEALIPRQGMRLGEALRIAIPVADALAAAHAKGIIHRDLKPANVMVGTDAVVKVVDFGLAKLVARDDGSGPDNETRTLVGAGVSAPGTIAGTAAYMSPEQALGEKVDARSDIFSFGATLFEMATGARAFPGASVADTLAAVIRAQPKPPTQIVASLPRELERLILRCLRKDPVRRYQSMLDVRNELQDIKEESDSGTPGVEGPPMSPSRVRWFVAAAAAALLVAAAVWYWQRPLPEPSLPGMRVLPLTGLTGDELSPSLSPDGEQLAFSWDQGKGEGSFHIFLKLVGSSDVRQLTQGPGDEWAGGWSPDGRQIACARRGSVFLLSPVLGTERKVVDFPTTALSGLSWTPDGRWLVTSGDASAPQGPGIYLLAVDGSSIRRIVASPGVGFVTVSSVGRSLAYLSCAESNSGFHCDLDVLTLDAAWNPTGAARRFASDAAVDGGVAWDATGASLLYATTPVMQTFLSRTWLRRDRPPERIELAGLGATRATVSAAAHRLAFMRVNNSVGVYTLAAAPRPVLTSSFWDIQPQFSPDGAKVAFTSSRSGDTLDIWLASSNGSNPRQQTHGPAQKQGSPSWSPDGRRIAFDSTDAAGRLSLWTIAADGGSSVRLTNGPGDQSMPTWSRDGRWIYYSQSEGHRTDIWRVPSTGGPGERVTSDGGQSFLAVESTDGRELIYKRESLTDGPLLARPLAGGPPRQLLPCVHNVNYAVVAGGIYYATCGDDPHRSIRLRDDAGHDRLIGGFDGPPFFVLDRMAVSPDGRTILVQRQTKSVDLMLIENFR